MFVRIFAISSLILISLSLSAFADISSVKFPATFKSLDGEKATVQINSGKTFQVPLLSLSPNKRLKSQQPVMVRLSREDLETVFKKRTNVN